MKRWTFFVYTCNKARRVSSGFLSVQPYYYFWYFLLSKVVLIFCMSICHKRNNFIQNFVRGRARWGPAHLFPVHAAENHYLRHWAENRQSFAYGAQYWDGPFLFFLCSASFSFFFSFFFLLFFLFLISFPSFFLFFPFFINSIFQNFSFWLNFRKISRIYYIFTILNFFQTSNFSSHSGIYWKL